MPANARLLNRRMSALVVLLHVGALSAITAMAQESDAVVRLQVQLRDASLYAFQFAR